MGSCRRACGLEVALSIAERALAAPRRACVLEVLVNANCSPRLSGVFSPNNHGWASWAKSLAAVGSNHTGHGTVEDA